MECLVSKEVGVLPGLGGNCDDYSFLPTSGDVSTTLKRRSPIASIAGSGSEESPGEAARDRCFLVSSGDADADEEDGAERNTCKKKTESVADPGFSI